MGIFSTLSNGLSGRTYKLNTIISPHINALMEKIEDSNNKLVGLVIGSACSNVITLTQMLFTNSEIRSTQVGRRVIQSNNKEGESLVKFLFLVNVFLLINQSTEIEQMCERENITTQDLKNAVFDINNYGAEEEKIFKELDLTSETDKMIFFVHVYSSLFEFCFNQKPPKDIEEATLLSQLILHTAKTN